MKNIVRSIFGYLLFIIPIVLIFLLIYGKFEEFEHSKASEKIVAEHKGHLALMDYMTNNLFNEYWATLKLIRNSNELNSYLENSTQIESFEVEQLFCRMCNNRNYIKNLVFTDINENKVIRLYDSESTADSLTEFNYLKQMSKKAPLKESEILISTPFITRKGRDDDSAYQYVIELGLPVYDSKNGNLSGLLVMMVDGEYLLKVFEEFLKDHPEKVHFALINVGSQTVLHYKEGSFYYLSDVKQLAKIREPKNAEKMKALKEGEFSCGIYECFFHNFTPLAEHTTFIEDEHFLTALTYFSKADVAQLEDSFILSHRGLKFIIAAVIVVVGIFLNLLFYFRKKDRQQLAVSNLVSDQSHDGVVITDSNQKVEYVNRTYRLMSGFLTDEIKTGNHKITNLDGKRFDISQTIKTDKESSFWKGLVWINGKSHMILSYLNLSVVPNFIDGSNQHVFLYSNPRNISNELLANVANEKRVKGEDLEFFPLQMIESKLANKEEFVVAIVQITNVDIIESNCSLDEEYLIASQIRKRLLKILDADDLLIQYFLGTFLLTKTITRYNYQNAISSIEKVFEKPFEIRDKQFPIIVRIGVSSLSRRVRNSALLLRQTKMAIAALTHFGRNGTLSYDKEIDDYLLRYYSILESLPNAINQGEIEVFFQPIIEIATSKIVSCEALSRWNHPLLNEISPSEFIPIVEKNGHERALGVYVFQQAAAFLNELDSLQQGSISVSINTCPSELQDVNLIPHFVKTLTQYNIKHDRIIVELTERTLLTDVDVAKKVLGGLRKERIRVAIDDFGVGFSSLSYLHDLEIDLLKIDRSFIKDYPKEDDGVIIKAMVGMAREFKVPVLVEGVETEEQLEFIKSLGVQYYQGFYFSEALNQKDFIELFKKNS